VAGLKRSLPAAWHRPPNHGHAAYRDRALLPTLLPDPGSRRGRA
jgi:hypothetical protein